MNELEARIASLEAQVAALREAFFGLDKNDLRALANFSALKEFVIHDQHTREEKDAAVLRLVELEKIWAERVYMNMGDFDPESAEKLDIRNPEEDAQS